ncbi:MAG: hypothetical protein KDK06_22340 [Gammaproteobacteria bacterium]|nr:hypothetical protein [Gammaproteobacteria bacterium]
MRRRDERALAAVPRAVLALLALALAAQVGWGLDRAAPRVTVDALPSPPSTAALEVLSFGEPRLGARLLMLWLQAFDYQPGVSLRFAALDYGRLEAWLARLLALDPRFQYPLLAAARIYGEVGDAPRQRRMIDFIRRAFAADPARRWPWLAHAVYLAKHRLHDEPLALDLARRLAAAPPSVEMPSWARQMHIFVLEDMGELEAARVLLGGLLDSGEIADSHERWFLSRRLHDLEQRLAESQSAAAATGRGDSE